MAWRSKILISLDVQTQLIFTYVASPWKGKVIPVDSNSGSGQQLSYVLDSLWLLSH